MSRANYNDRREISFFTYLALFFGIAAVCLVTVKFGYFFGIAVSFLPLIVYVFLKSLNNPSLAMMELFVFSYVIPIAGRYFYNLPVGIIMDVFVIFNLLSLIILSCYRKIGWKRGWNGLTVVSIIWLIYCIFQLFNPQSVSSAAWFATVRSYAFYPLALAIFIPVVFPHFKDLKILLVIWSVLTLLAVLKALVQKYIGFTPIELDWLYNRGGRTTHMIGSVIRYFSFFTDAANFGTNMGISMVVLSISAFSFKNKWVKRYFLIVSALACYGLLLSGTRSSIVVPLVAYVIYILMSKNGKVILYGTVAIIVIVVFFRFTAYGQGNAIIRRTRSAFYPSNDKSFVVRLENQKKLKTYLADKPFGVGLGLGGGKALEYAPYAFASQIPTDSWFVMAWVESGIVGLGLRLILFMYVACYGTWVVMFRIKNKDVRRIISSFLGVYIGTLTNLYANEVLVFPNSTIFYMIQAFFFVALLYDKDLLKESETKTKKLEA